MTSQCPSSLSSTEHGPADGQRCSRLRGSISLMGGPPRGAGVVVGPSCHVGRLPAHFDMAAPRRAVCDAA